MPYATDARHFDAATLHALRYQGDRMQHVLHKTLPPDRKEAKMIQARVDDILDRRPRNHVISPDGEIVWEGAVSPFVLEQAMTLAVNATGEPERVLKASDLVPAVSPLLTDDEERAVNRFRDHLNRKDQK
jgi:hypothetical protein